MGIKGSSNKNEPKRNVDDEYDAHADDGDGIKV